MLQESMLPETVSGETARRGVESSACRQITAASLGSAQFREDYGVKYAYVAGAMYKGIASQKLVIALAGAGLMSYFGAGGLSLEEIAGAILGIQARLGAGQPYGMNLLCNLEKPDMEERTVDLYLKHAVRCVEAAAFMGITPALVLYRLSGTHRDRQGNIVVPNRVLAKVSRLEVAEAFMRPAPEAIVKSLVARRRLTEVEAELGRAIPVAGDLCVESDSAGHTDQGVALVLLPAMLALRDDMMAAYRYPCRIRIGAAGGIGTPSAAAAAFVMGADFILTGSVNQCTVEAGTSESVKDMLQELDVRDTAYAPAGDMFELGARVQVVKRGSLFSSRANRLYEIYRQYDSLDDIDPKVKRQLEEKYFRRPFEQVWQEARTHYLSGDPGRIREFESTPKKKMALIFKWYFRHTTRVALRGEDEYKVDYQIHCGPALGAFNRWVKGTPLQRWRDRRVAEVAERLMHGAADLLHRQFDGLARASVQRSAVTLIERSSK